MNLNLEKDKIIDKKSNKKKYIVNSIIILLMLGLGNAIGEGISNGVTTEEYNSTKTQYESTLTNLEIKQSELDKINYNIEQNTSAIDELNTQLESERKN